MTKKEMILKIFNSMSDEEKTDLQREITVLTRDIIVPPISPGIDFDGTDSDAVVDEPGGRERRQSMAQLRKLAGINK